MLNRVALVGRLTRDPELRRTGNGTAVTSFTLAVDRNFSTRDGQEADFINCVVWRKPAENVAQYCSKGSLVSVDGRIQTRSYDNNQGQRVYVTEVVADSVQFLETRAQRERAQQSAPMMQQPTMTQQPRQNNNDFYDMKTVDLDKDFDDSVNMISWMTIFNSNRRKQQWLSEDREWVEEKFATSLKTRLTTSIIKMLNF